MYGSEFAFLQTYHIIRPPGGRPKNGHSPGFTYTARAAMRRTIWMYPLEKFNSFQKKVNEIAMEDPVIIVKVMGNIHPNDDLPEKVAR